MSIDSIVKEKYDTPREITKVGEIVVATGLGSALRSGSCEYDCAIMIKVDGDNLVGVSKDTDMRWGSTIDREDFKAIGVATDEALEKCMRRADR